MMYEKYVEKWSGRQYMNKIKEKKLFSFDYGN